MMNKLTALWSYQGGDVILTRLEFSGKPMAGGWDALVEELEKQDAAAKDLPAIKLVPQDVSLYALFEGHAEMIMGTAS